MLIIQDDIKLNIIIFLFGFVDRDSEGFDNPGTLISTTNENIEIVLNCYFELVEVGIVVVDSVKSRNNHFNVN